MSGNLLEKSKSEVGLGFDSETSNEVTSQVAF